MLIHSSVLTEMEHVAAQTQCPQLRVEIQEHGKSKLLLRVIGMGMKRQTSRRLLHLYSAISQYFTAKLMRYQGVYSCYYSRQKNFSMKMSDTS